MEIEKIISQHNIPIKKILIAEGLSDRAASLLQNIGFTNKKTILITDQNVFVFAHKIFKQLNWNLDCKLHVLLHPKADQKTVLEIISEAEGCDLIVAVGSGTINDLCKLASFRLKIPYIIFGTAPSMNGYASGNASITIDNHKTSVAAHLPTAIYLDLKIVSQSLPRLIKAGIGDSLCFSTCRFDWLLSHLMLETSYNPAPFDLLEPYYQKMLTFNSIFDQQFIEALCKTLIVSGLGMSIAGGSYPASQAEHLIAHYIEITHPEIAIESHHGEQIAVCTLSVAALQEQILQQQNLQINPTNFDQNNLKEIFGKPLSEHFWQAINKKSIDQNRAEKINQNLQKNWPQIKQQLKNVFISKNQLLEFYHQFGLRETPREIGLEEQMYDRAANNAHLIRDRFTTLDLIKIIKY